MTSLLTQLCGQPVGSAISPALITAICRANDDDLIRQFAGATKQQQQTIAVHASVCIRLHKTQSMLQTGLFIHLFIAATPEASRREQTEQMKEETGIDRTQQYRCRNAFIRFGRVLLPDDQLASRFVPEATKRLSEPKIAETASYEAIKRARADEIITIRVAEDIITAHSPTTDVVVSDGSSAGDETPANDTVPLTTPEATTRRTRREEISPETMQGIAQRRRELDDIKAAHENKLGECIHQDNTVQVFVRSVVRPSGPTDEEILFAIQAAYRKLSSSNPVQAIVAETLTTTSSGDQSLV